MKTSPVKYDMNLVSEKMKKMNKIYEGKNKHGAAMSKTEETYYKYNLLYGTKSNEIIRAYSPKMRPMSASISNFKRDNFHNNSQCFTKEEVTSIYQAKCEDLDLRMKDNLEKKFQDYCERKCVNREADFTECNFKSNCASVISEILGYNEKISHLILSKNGLGDSGVEILMKRLKNSLTIVHLDLSSNDITHKGGDAIFENLKNQESITSLNLSSIDGINRNRLTAEGIKKIEEVLKNNYFLQYLNLSSNSLKNEGLKYILNGLNNNHSLLELNLSHNEITHHGISYFNTILKGSKLFELDISQNPIGNEGCDIIGDCINKNNLHSLKKLNLSDCKITFNGMYNLIFNLQSNKKLETLNLNGNNLSNDKFSKIKPILPILNLKELKLSKCKLGNEGAISIAEGFINNTSLISLDISENRIDDKGFGHFSDFPTVNYTLEKFDISKNLITDASCREFIRNLAKNSKIKTLNFFDNQLKNETGTALVDVMRYNKNITKINLKFNRIPTRIQEEIDKLLKKNSENYKQTFVPNLKREIRQIYVTENDFEHTDYKIQETGTNLKNVNLSFLKK
jgi:Ran GTPase-activating protein (RanGAP) involved in mRNA processing and transport